MNDFVQMDVFFFISSITSLIFLFFVLLIGLYVFLIVKKINHITKEFKDLSIHISQKGKETIDQISSKIETALNNGGTLEKIIASIVGTILAYYLGFRGKIKKDARKK